LQWKSGQFCDCSPENTADTDVTTYKSSITFTVKPFLPSMSDSACALRPDGTLKDASEIEFFNDVDDNVPMLASSVTLVPAPQPLALSFSQGKLDSFVSRFTPAAVIASSQ
jgi:hypothetical protein